MKSPFKLLDPYDIHDKDVFFGRQEEIEALYSMVFKTPLILVYGLSGTGKTSLVQCGLASRFAGPNWFPFFIRRGNDINDSIKKTLLSVFPEGERFKEHLYENIRILFRHYLRPVYLIFDQFEELFILGNKEEQRVFADSIHDLIDSEIPCKIILIIREEFHGQLYYLEKEIPTIYDHRLRVEPMGLKKVKEVLEKSFNKFNIELQNPDQNLERIYHNISAGKSGIQLPYLQVYLDMLWKEDLKRTYPDGLPPGTLPILRFTTDEINSFGAIHNVLDRFLKEQENGLQIKLRPEYPDVYETGARQVLDIFVTEEGTKRPVPIRREEGIILLEGPAKEVLANFPEGALQIILKEFEVNNILRERDDHLELSHDSLAALIDNQRTERQKRINDMFTRLRMTFKAFESEPDLEKREYLSQRQLALLEEFPELKPMMDEHLVAFVSESQKEANRELERERQRRRSAEKAERKAKRNSLIAFSALGVAVIAAIFAYSFFIQSEIAFKRLQKATDDSFRSTMNDISELANSTNFESAYQKIKVAVPLTKQPKVVEKYLTEIAYVFNEAGKPEKAREVLDYLNENVRKSPGYDSTVIESKKIREEIFEISPSWSDTLKSRYATPKLIPINGGRYLMGCDPSRGDSLCEKDETPSHWATLSDFSLALTETTVWQFSIYCLSNNIDIQAFASGTGLKGPNPITNISWHQAAHYANWVSRINGLKEVYTFDLEGKNVIAIDYDLTPSFRLPTESQWEYAARGGLFDHPTLYAGGDTLDQVGWYGNNSKIGRAIQPHPVRLKRPNELGLYDMTGNVWEWCQDYWDEGFKYSTNHQTNPQGPPEGNYRISRGGAYNTPEYFGRVSDRNYGVPFAAYPATGFRLCYF